MPQLTDLKIDFISLVKRPATGKSLTLKNGTHEASLFEIKKMDDDRQVAYGIVYAPDEVDSQGDMATSDTIRSAAYGFMKKGRNQNIDTEHNFETTHAYVAESWLVRKDDPLFADEPEGAWAVGIQITSPDLWQKLKAGDYTGLSLAGTAARKNDDVPPNWFTKFIKNLNLTQKTEQKSMNEDEIRKLVQDELTKSQHTDAEKEEENPTEPAPPTEPTPPAPCKPSKLTAQ